MPHFGVLSYKGAGHLNPLIALSKQLMARGHRVTFFLPSEMEHRVRQHGLGFYAIDIPDAAKRQPSRVQSRLKKPVQFSEVQDRLDHIAGDMEAYMSQYPIALRDAGIDVLIVGEISLTGPSVAEMLSLPYFIISTSIPHNFGWHAPRSIARYSPLEREQKKALEVSVLRMKGPVRRILDQYRRQTGLGSVLRIKNKFPELAHITQWPQCLDVPRSKLPDNFYYAGPFIDESARAAVEFPWEKLDGRPLVYASLGTTRRGDPAIFCRIAEACTELDVQLIISFGGRRDAIEPAGLAGNPLVVRNAPQIELLKKAQIVITHAGPNTVLEALMHGKPMLAMPITLDQPAIAARLAKLKVAEILPGNSSTERIRTALIHLQKDSGYRDAAQKIQEQMQSLHGLERTANIIEERMMNYAGSHVEMPLRQRTYA